MVIELKTFKFPTLADVIFAVEILVNTILAFCVLLFDTNNVLAVITAPAALTLRVAILAVSILADATFSLIIVTLVAISVFE